MSIRKFIKYPVCLFIAFSLFSISALSQENTTATQVQNESTIEGNVASSARQTFVVRTPDNQFYLFTFNRYTNKPQSLAVGTRVRVESRPGVDTGSRLATRVAVLEAAPNDQQHAAGTDVAPIPESVRNVESEIRSESPTLETRGTSRSCI